MANSCCACEFEDTSYLATSCGNSMVTFMGLVDLLLRTRCDISDACRRAGKPNVDLGSEPEFDFVIVGAGVSGPVVASRLSENPDWTVLLIEAGPEEPTTTQIPAFFMGAVGTQLDWNITTQSQPGACRETNGECKWPRGRMVAGTSAMTGMMYTRGTPDVYDKWAAMGNDGWSFSDVLPYFKMSENNKNFATMEQDFHGRRGPLTVQHFPFMPPMVDSIVAGGKEMGYRSGDLNGKNHSGITRAQVMVDDGIRASPARMYLRKAHNRANLKVLINTHVARVLINPDNMKATGVEILNSNGKRSEILARKEVILSAGSIASPQLLLLSGVGPANDLQQMGIPILQDLPVGKNLRNHVSLGVGFYINDTEITQLNLDTLNQFVRTRGGPMAATGLTQVGAFIMSKYAEKDRPDLQVFFDGFWATCSRTGMTRECMDGSMGNCGDRYILTRPTALLPQSHGYLTLRSTNPLDHPLIYPNYLTVQRDVEVLIDGVRLVQKLAKTKALQKWGIRQDDVPKPLCADQTYDSDAYWECIARTYTGPENHQGGTCKMAPRQDGGVVDSRLRVYGVEGLRVIDASIFPFIPNGNPISAITMTGEKGADMIKQEHMSNEI